MGRAYPTKRHTLSDRLNGMTREADAYFRPTDTGRMIKRCPNCGRETKLQRNDQRVVWPKITQNLAPPHTPYALEEVWTCVLCDKSMIEIHVFEESDRQDRSAVEVRFVYPNSPPRNLPSEAPETVASLFREASVAENAGAMRGAAGLYRATVEALVNDRGVASGNLQNKIEELKKLDIDNDIVDDLHEARLLGNWSLHDGLEFTPDEIADVAHLVVDAVEQLYVEPARRQAMRQSRKDRRLAAQVPKAPPGPCG